MGILDKIKGFVGGNANKVEGAIDKVAEVAKDKVPDEHDGKVDQAVDKAKDALDKLSGDEA